MSRIYRRFIRETAGRIQLPAPQIFFQMLSDNVPVSDIATAVLQIFPRIKVKTFDELLKLVDANTVTLNQANSVKYPILFPRMNGGTQAYTTAWAADGFQNMDAVLLGGRYENVPSNRPAVLSTLVAGNGFGIKCKPVQYMISDCYTENNNYSISVANAPVWNAYVNANNMHLYLNGTSGKKAPNFYRSDFTQLNQSDYASVPTVGGRKLEDEFARQMLSNFITGGFAGCSSDIYAFFHDNVMHYAGAGTNVPANADWDRDGTSDVTRADAVSLKFRTGQKRYVDYIRANQPGLKVVANLSAQTLNEAGQRCYDVGPSALFPEYGVWDGCMFETVYGDKTYSMIQWAGNTATWKCSQYYQDFCIDPQLTQWSIIGMQSNGTDTIRTALGQAFRWSFTACLIFTDMGYNWTGSSGNRPDGISSKLDFFGEFSAHPNTGVCSTAWSNAAQWRKWMGTRQGPRVAYNASPWQNGCYRRIFNGQNGKPVMVIHNPTTSPQRVTLDANYRRLTGGSDPAINDGRAQNTGSFIDIPGQDGIILLGQ